MLLAESRERVSAISQRSSHQPPGTEKTAESTGLRKLSRQETDGLGFTESWAVGVVGFLRVKAGAGEAHLQSMKSDVRLSGREQDQYA